MNITVRPKCLAYLTRAQGMSDKPMFDPSLYHQYDDNYNYHNNYHDNSNNNILQFDRIIQKYPLNSILDDKVDNDDNKIVINEENINSNISIDDTDDLTLVNSNLLSSNSIITDQINENVQYQNQNQNQYQNQNKYQHQYLNEIENFNNSTFQVQSSNTHNQEIINNIKIGSKRKSENTNYNTNNNNLDYDYDYVDHGYNNKKHKVNIQHEQFISSDFISLHDDVETTTDNTNNDNNNNNDINDNDNYHNFSQLKHLNNESFPIYTSREIMETAISSFDPIFYSED